MFILYNLDDYVLDKAHYIEKSKTYQLYNDINDETITISGTDLIKRINKDIKLNSLTIKNVRYKSKPIIYIDTVLKPIVDNRIYIDIKNATISCNCNLPFKVFMRQVNDVVRVITIDNYCLPVLMNTVNKNLVIEFGCKSIKVVVNEDCELYKVFMKDVTFTNNTLKFVLHFGICNNVQQSLNCSLSYNILLDFSKSVIVADNFREKLLTVGEYAKTLVLTDTKSTDLPFDKFSSLSNYYNCDVFYDGRHYKSSEAAYQSAKTLNPILRNKFINLTPDESKTLGKQIEKTSDFRSDWESIKLEVMHDIILAKFTQNRQCRADLAKTKGFNLIEDTTGWCDKIWGRCYCSKCKGSGLNWLGLTLNRVRKELGYE